MNISDVSPIRSQNRGLVLRNEVGNECGLNGNVPESELWDEIESRPGTIFADVSAGFSGRSFGKTGSFSGGFARSKLVRLR
jgi:hypothetical protein